MPPVFKFDRRAIQPLLVAALGCLLASVAAAQPSLPLPPFNLPPMHFVSVAPAARSRLAQQARGSLSDFRSAHANLQAGHGAMYQLMLAAEEYVTVIDNPSAIPPERRQHVEYYNRFVKALESTIRQRHAAGQATNLELRQARALALAAEFRLAKLDAVLRGNRNPNPPGTVATTSAAPRPGAPPNTSTSTPAITLPDGKGVEIQVSADKRIVVRLLETNRIQDPEELTCSADGGQFVVRVGTSNLPPFRLSLWSVNERKLVHYLSAQQGKVPPSGSIDDPLKFADELQFQMQFGKLAAFSLDGKLFAAIGENDGRTSQGNRTRMSHLLVWETATGKLLRVTSDDVGFQSPFQFVDSTRILVSRVVKGVRTIDLLAARSGQLTNLLPMVPYTIDGAAVRNSQVLLFDSQARSMTVSLLSKEARPFEAIPGDSSPRLYRGWISADGKEMQSLGDQTLHCWNMQSHKYLRGTNLPDPVSSSYGGPRLATEANLLLLPSYNQWKVIQLDKATIVGRIQVTAGAQVRHWSDDGSRLLADYRNQTLLLEFPTGVEVGTVNLEEHLRKLVP